MIKYYKLLDLLNRRGMKKTDLLNVISTPTLAKISKHQYITLESIDKICTFLNCQPGDIMEHIISQEEETIEDAIIRKNRRKEILAHSTPHDIIDDVVEVSYVRNSDEGSGIIIEDNRIR